MPHDYANAQVREAAERVTEWDHQNVVYVPERDGNLAAGQATHLVNGWTIQISLESTSDPAVPQPAS